MRESETRLSMNRGLMEATERFVHGGLADGPLPLTPALSLGKKEIKGSARLKVHCMRE
jgi:hypothetical protein